MVYEICEGNLIVLLNPEDFESAVMGTLMSGNPGALVPTLSNLFVESSEALSVFGVDPPGASEVEIMSLEQDEALPCAFSHMLCTTGYGSVGRPIPLHRFTVVIDASFNRVADAIGAAYIIKRNLAKYVQASSLVRLFKDGGVHLAMFAASAREPIPLNKFSFAIENHGGTMQAAPIPEFSLNFSEIACGIQGIQKPDACLKRYLCSALPNTFGGHSPLIKRLALEALSSIGQTAPTSSESKKAIVNKMAAEVL